MSLDSPPTAPETLSLRVIKVIFENPQNGYAIALGKTSAGKLSTVAGHLGKITRGQALEVSGHWTRHSKYGEQFQALGKSGGVKLPAGPAAKLAAIAEQAGLPGHVVGSLAGLPDWLATPGLANPYSLIGEVWLEWDAFDRLGLLTSGESRGIYRVEGALRYLLLEFPGPCKAAGIASARSFLPEDLALAQASQMLGLEPEEIQAALAGGASQILRLLGPDGSPILMERSLAVAEDTIHRRVQALSETLMLKLNPETHDLLDGDLSKDQLSAIHGTLQHGISLLSGPPGVGKTRTIASMLRMLEGAGYSVAVAAFTGKAADRFNQVYGKPVASTIHRLLECKPVWNGAFAFTRNAGNPLEVDVLIVDESSMVCTSLMADLLSALGGDARIILVGDEHQIPPVSPGQPFADFIASKACPIFRLTRIFRQAEGSAIAEACRVVLEGNPSKFFEFLRSPEAAEELCWIPSETPEEIAREVEKVLRGGKGIPPQILAPIKQGEAGALALNATAKAVFNPRHAGTYFRLSDGSQANRKDPVMWIKNDAVRQVFNGDSFILGQMQGRDEVELEGFARNLRINPRETSKLLIMAYALTVHKAQGNEWPEVILTISPGSRGFLTRALLYTGLSRAKSRSWIIGSPRAIRLAIESAQAPVLTRLAKLLESTYQ